MICIPSKQLPFTIQTQQQTNWCWAACACSISVFFNSAPIWSKQCTLANTAFGISGTNDCCTNGSSSSCNLPCDPNKALTITKNSQQNSFSGAASIPQIQTEINAGHPIFCEMLLNGGNDVHCVVIYGYNFGIGSASLNIADPEPGVGYSIVPYDTFKSAYRGSGKWNYTYLIQP